MRNGLTDKELHSQSLYSDGDKYIKGRIIQRLSEYKCSRKKIPKKCIIQTFA